MAVQIDLLRVQDVHPFAWTSLAFQERPAGRSVSLIFSPGFLDHRFYYLLDFLRFEYMALLRFTFLSTKAPTAHSCTSMTESFRRELLFASKSQFVSSLCGSYYIASPFHFAPDIIWILSRVPLICWNELSHAFCACPFLFRIFMDSFFRLPNREAYLSHFSILLDLNLLGYWNRILKTSLVNQALMSSTPRQDVTVMVEGMYSWSHCYRVST